MSERERERPRNFSGFLCSKRWGLLGTFPDIYPSARNFPRNELKFFQDFRFSFSGRFDSSREISLAFQNSLRSQYNPLLQILEGSRNATINYEGIWEGQLVQFYDCFWLIRAAFGIAYTRDIHALGEGGNELPCPLPVLIFSRIIRIETKLTKKVKVSLLFREDISIFFPYSNRKFYHELEPNLLQDTH